MPNPENPLLEPWRGPYGGVPPWDHLDPKYFPSAFEAALAEGRRELEENDPNPAAPTFENTLEALERSGAAVDRMQRLFGVARENVTTPEYQALEREWQPK